MRAAPDPYAPYRDPLVRDIYNISSQPVLERTGVDDDPTACSGDTRTVGVAHDQEPGLRTKLPKVAASEFRALPPGAAGFDDLQRQPKGPANHRHEPGCAARILAFSVEALDRGPHRGEMSLDRGSDRISPLGHGLVTQLLETIGISCPRSDLLEQHITMRHMHETVQQVQMRERRLLRIMVAGENDRLGAAGADESGKLVQLLASGLAVRLEERLHGIPVQHDCAGTLKQRPELRHLPDAAQRMPDMQVGEDTDWERVRHENFD